MEDPHKYFHQRVVIIGGRNSAAETTIRCFYAGAYASLVFWKPQLNPEIIKYWILPDLISRIEEGVVNAYYNTVPIEIKHGSIVLKNLVDERIFEIPADFVIKNIGFNADMHLCQQIGVQIVTEKHCPRYNPDTMETNIPGAYVAGTVIAGTQSRFTVFIENSHAHVDRIIKQITAILGVENKWVEHTPTAGKLDE
jgi:thioredoxin reductase (NADPH)